MRATMNDGRQLVGQMLAFDKVQNPARHSTRPSTNIHPAHEPRPLRLRRIPQGQTQDQSRRRNLHRRDRREAQHRPGNHPRRKRRLVLSRRSTAFRSCCETRNECAWCCCADGYAGRTRNLETSWERSRIARAGAGHGRVSGSWVSWCAAGRVSGTRGTATWVSACWVSAGWAAW